MSIAAKARIVKAFSEEARRKIFDFFLINQIPWYGTLTQTQFLERIFDLENLPSTDPRFTNAKEDITKHTINNNDWDDDWIFSDVRFNLLNCTEKVFFNFLTLTIHPLTKRDKETKEKLLSFFTKVLDSQGFKLEIIDSVDGEDIYEIRKKIVVFDTELKVIIVDYPRRVFQEKNKAPCLVLVKDNWNDFGFQTSFNAHFIPDTGDIVNLGYIKITDGNTLPTYKRLPKNFVQLGKGFISIGNSLEYYEKLSKLGRPIYSRILSILNDVATNKMLLIPFKDNEVFKVSLLRESETIKALNEAGKFFESEFNSFEETLKFTFTTKLENAEEQHKIELDFKESNLPHRINVFIGKNGTGKTQVLANIANSLSGVSQDKTSFGNFNIKPTFSKIVTLSYSAFDFFEIPEINNINVTSYKYCGIRKRMDTLYTTAELREKFLETLRIVIDKDRRLDWKNAIRTIINIDVDFLEDNENSIQEIDYIYNKLSSGQKIVVTLVTEIIAFIQPESLLLFDEPELHLHPNIVIKFINMISLVLERFNSYAIIATHSPIVLQQVPVKYVIHFSREGNVPTTRRLNIETFGESYTLISEEVFNTLETETHYKQVLEDLSKAFSFEEILKIFDNKLSMNAKIYLKAINNRPNEENKSL